MTNKNRVSHNSERYEYIWHQLTGHEGEKELCQIIKLKRLICPLCGRRYFYKVDVCVADPNDCHQTSCPGTCENTDYQKSFNHGNQTFCPFCRYDEEKEYQTKCKARQPKTKNKNSRKLKEMGITRERHDQLIKNDYTQRNDRTIEKDHASGAPTAGAQLIVSTNNNINNAGRFIRHRNTSHFKIFDSYFNKNKHIKKNASHLDGKKHIIRERRRYPTKKLSGKLGKGCVHPWEGVKRLSWPVPGLKYNYNPEPFTVKDKKSNSCYNALRKYLSNNYACIPSKFSLNENSVKDRVIKKCNPPKVETNHIKRLSPILNRTFTPFYYYPNPYDETKRPMQWKEWIYNKTYLGKLIYPIIKDHIKDYYTSINEGKLPPGCSKPNLFPWQPSDIEEKICNDEWFIKNINEVSITNSTLIFTEKEAIKQKIPKKSKTKYWLGLWKKDGKKQYYPLNHWEAFQPPKEHLNLKETHYHYSKENNLNGGVLGFLPIFQPKHKTSETTSFYNAGELSGALLTREKQGKGINKPFDGWSKHDLILDSISDHIKKCYTWNGDTIKLPTRLITNPKTNIVDDNKARTSKIMIPVKEQETSVINLKNTDGKNKKFIKEWLEDVKHIKAPEVQPEGEWYPANRTEHEGLSPYWKDPCWNESDSEKCFKNSRCKPESKKEYDQAHERILKILKMNADS